MAVDVVAGDGVVEVLALEDVGDLEGDQPVRVGVGELEGIGCLSSLEIIPVLDIKVLVVDDAVVVLENLDVDGI